MYLGKVRDIYSAFNSHLDNIPALHVEPAPIGIDDNLSILRRAAALSSTCLPGHSRMGLSLLRAHELAADDGEERSGKDKRAIHIENRELIACLKTRNTLDFGGLSS